MRPVAEGGEEALSDPVADGQPRGRKRAEGGSDGAASGGFLKRALNSCLRRSPSRRAASLSASLSPIGAVIAYSEAAERVADGWEKMTRLFLAELRRRLQEGGSTF